MTHRWNSNAIEVERELVSWRNFGTKDVLPVERTVNRLILMLMIVGGKAAILQI